MRTLRYLWVIIKLCELCNNNDLIKASDNSTITCNKILILLIIIVIMMYIIKIDFTVND